MPPTAPSHRRALALAAALLLLPLAAACGVEVRDDTGSGPDVTSIDGTTAPTPPCADEPDTGGAVGVDDEAPACVPDPRRTTTTEATPTDDEQAYVDALASELRSDDTFGELRRDQSTCIAESWVATLDPQRLDDAGISAQDLRTGSIDEALAAIIDDDVAADLIGSLGGCDVDVDTILADELRSGDSVPADKVDCLIAALPEGYVENLLALSLAGGRDALDADPDLQAPLVDAAQQCQ